MSMEEKQKLGIGLQSLPQEKMPRLVHIIRKRNLQLTQESDEIELDSEALDTDTLWELDRFVTNWKKLVSKTKNKLLWGITQQLIYPQKATQPSFQNTPRVSTLIGLDYQPKAFTRWII